ncbi:zinc ABC transporter substrate-binding protein [Erwinia tracheiphila]|uniref:DUF2502 domain-containing protein n=1 Tax=Erwinia tracheiphila TaxID=65700 RepID=A0A345CTD9_9GAMM|nr:zinc ABC transporter substrate-binding protein [Erwinia tracheiphila]AXF76706.1 DUF2502 domain-containing protein [Erwinia tracheiphila]UIA84620.1 zinc ABC transporter substrate-binding protein [Erwinia tracheiphila]UIA93212.1 zinc ABC transporter substrate-binding protein [Erwinia tracheiphila]
MKRLSIVVALLACLPPLAVKTAQADGADIVLAPGVQLHVSDHDPHGRYWGGGRLRDQQDWDNYRDDEERCWCYQQWRRHEAWRQHEEWRRHREWERERRWHDDKRYRDENPYP